MVRPLAAVALAAAVLPAPAIAQAMLPGEIFTSLVATSLGSPDPVMGADGRRHLAFELVVSNPGRLFMTLDRLDVVDEAGAVHATVEGAALRAMTVTWTLVDGSLPPGGTAVVLLDVALDPRAKVPGRIIARVTATRRIMGRNGTPAPLPADAAVPATITFTAAETGVGAAAVVIDAPLKGAGWVALNGCCDAPTSHRTAFQAINARLRAPERFAIDWMRLDAGGRLFTGDGSRLEDYAFYGAPVYAVSAGMVVSVFDGLAPQVPLSRDPNIRPGEIAGNSIVLDIGAGRYVLYAHLLKGSATVKAGDRVEAGQELARLGNTGNSDGPHLHFQVMDGPSPLDANGLPFAIRRFSSRGSLAGGADAAFAASMAGTPVPLDGLLSGRHVDAMPLNNQVVDFP